MESCDSILPVGKRYTSVWPLGPIQLLKPFYLWCGCEYLCAMFKQQLGQYRAVIFTLGSHMQRSKPEVN